MKKRFLFPFLLFLLLLLPLSVSAETAYLYDGADLYTQEEQTEINDLFAEIENESGLLCVLVTRTESQDTLALLPDYAGGAVDMLLLDIDMSRRYLDVYQYNGVDGEAGYRVSTSESDKILDAVQSDLAAGDYLAGARHFGEMAQQAFLDNEGDGRFDPAETGDDYEYMPYEPDDDTASVLLSRALIALGFGCLVGGIAVLIVRARYKRKTHGETYPLKEFSSLSLTQSKDTFSHKTLSVVRKPEPQENHSSGGGSSGGHSGGGSHMGGRSF